LAGERAALGDGLGVVLDRGVIFSQSSRFSMLIVWASTPARSAIRIWLPISARSGEMRIVGPAPASRSTRVAMKYTADLPQVRWTSSSSKGAIDHPERR
jgi:hypothetical protein